MARPALPKNEESLSRRKVPVYPRIVVRGGHPWSFAGYGNESIYPSPGCTPWSSGWMDEITRQAMLCHAKVSGAVNILKNGALGDGARCVPCISPYGPDKAEFTKAYEISRFCDHVLRHTGNFFTAARQMTACFHEGNKLAPLDFKEIEFGRYKNKVGLGKIITWPNGMYQYLRDEYGDTVKVQVYAGVGENVEVPMSDFWHMTWRPINNNPHGTIGLVPAYLPFYRDIQNNTQEMAYMARFSSLSIIIFASPPPDGETEELQDLFYSDGTPVMEVDPDTGDMVQRQGYAVEQNKLMFIDFRAGSVWSMEAGAKVQEIQANPGGAELFQNMRDANAREITGAILGTSQLTESASNLSSSNQNVGEGVAGLNITEMKKILELSVEQNILRELVRRNYGNNAIDLLPIMDFGSGENGRIPQIFNSIVGFVNGGAFSRDQFWWWCLKMGLPMPIPDSEPVVKSIHPAGGGDKTNANDTAKKPSSE